MQHCSYLGCPLEKDFTLFNCKFIDKILRNFDDPLDIIGLHGQTIFHNSNEKISEFFFKVPFWGSDRDLILALQLISIADLLKS